MFGGRAFAAQAAGHFHAGEQGQLVMRVVEAMHFFGADGERRAVLQALVVFACRRTTACDWDAEILGKCYGRAEKTVKNEIEAGGSLLSSDRFRPPPSHCPAADCSV